ncbi:hypothetical protein SDC9_93357 [bioreactor metagenome]|uniref:Uncharacterized protein n=1 Tax=bioreactor metagenome TaxID=1076179 RepID=A0A645A0T2_9ZZZZ
MSVARKNKAVEHKHHLSETRTIDAKRRATSPAVGIAKIEAGRLYHFSGRTDFIRSFETSFFGFFIPYTAAAWQIQTGSIAGNDH